MKTERNFYLASKSKLPPVNFFTALVVDDYKPAKQLLGASLTSMPHIGEVEYASSGEEALKKVANKSYDLIFLDVDMPGISGFETCARIREINGYEITPIVMVTGNNEPTNKFKCVLSGCTSYLTKPIQQRQFWEFNMNMISWLEDCKAA